VIGEELGGWLKGENKGKIGIFPSIFTEEYSIVDSMFVFIGF